MRIRLYYDGGELTIQDYDEVKNIRESAVVLRKGKEFLLVTGQAISCSYFSVHELTLVGDIRRIEVSDHGL